MSPAFETFDILGMIYGHKRGRHWENRSDATGHVDPFYFYDISFLRSIFNTFPHLPKWGVAGRVGRRKPVDNFSGDVQMFYDGRYELLRLE